MENWKLGRAKVRGEADRDGRWRLEVVTGGWGLGLGSGVGGVNKPILNKGWVRG